MLFSIIITTYNYEKYIKKSVESALSQDYSQEYEVIVVDDFSKDNTLQILDDYSSLVRINNNRNLCLEVSANKAIKKAKGKYIVRLDADDYLRKNFLSEMSKFLVSEDVFYYSDYTTVSENGSCISLVNLLDFDRKEIESRGDFLATGTVYPKKLLLSVGMYSEEHKNCGLENYQLILKLMKNGCQGLHIKKNLFFYRKHSNSLSFQKFESIMNYGSKIAQNYGLSCYVINQYHPYLSIKDMDDNPLACYKLFK